MNLQRIARGLGWFSLALGAAEILAPERLNRALGVRRSTALTRGYGVREIAAGLGILAQRRHRSRWIWSRVAGDALDLGTLALVMRGSRKKKIVAAAIMSVAAVTAVDMFVGMRMSGRGDA